MGVVQNSQTFLTASTSTHRNFDMGVATNAQAKRNQCSSGRELDPEVWRNLPPELVARVLALLPLTSLIHTELISQRWDRAIYSGRILRAGGGAGDERRAWGRIIRARGDARDGQRAWLYLFETERPGLEFHAFDPARCDWQTVNTLLPRFALSGVNLCSAAAGVVVYAIRNLRSQFVRFGVFNPVTRSWKRLPPLLQRRHQPVVAVIADVSGARRGYKVVVAGGMEYDERVGSTEVYDSRTECWRTTCEKFGNRVASHVCEEMRTSTAVCDGMVYHIRFCQRLSFDPSRGRLIHQCQFLILLQLTYGQDRSFECLQNFCSKVLALLTYLHSRILFMELWRLQSF